MKLKSPTDVRVKVALLSGHVFNVPPEGADVPKMFIKEAFKLGCIPAEVDIAEVDIDEVYGGEVANDAKERSTIIEDAIKSMLESGAKMNGDGLPGVRELGKICGFTVERVEMVDAWNKLQSEAE